MRASQTGCSSAWRSPPGVRGDRWVSPRAGVSISRGAGDDRSPGSLDRGPSCRSPRFLGQRALGRGDLRAAIHLLSRADALLSSDDPSRSRLRLDLGAALTEFGDFNRADGLYGDIVDRARARGDRGTELHALLALMKLRQLSGPEGTRNVRSAGTGSHRRVRATRRRVAAPGAVSYDLIGHGHLRTCTSAPPRGLGAGRPARGGGGQSARRIDVPLVAGTGGEVAATPVDEAVERCEAIFERAGDDRTIHAFVLDARSALEAMRGRFDEARAMVAQARATYAELGLNVMGANLAQTSGYVEMLAGDALAAEHEFRSGYEALRTMDEKDPLHCGGSAREGALRPRTPSGCAAVHPDQRGIGFARRCPISSAVADRARLDPR